jgi:3-hydroxyacyl-CoA dehydrogenase / enoyl-CoA hydratase / 3-hydroxybutyryl-CoA epimerase
MTDTMFRWDLDPATRIVTVTMDDPDQGANTMNERFQTELPGLLDRLESEKENLAGVILTSAKSTFFAGGDLKMLSQAQPEQAAEIKSMVEGMKAQLRRLETLGIPVVAAINGAALGGGLEIALACHRRIAVDAKGSKIGLPEVTLGLLPGGGGVTRTVRMFGLQKALMEVLLQGQQRSPKQAAEVGLIDEVVTDDAAATAAAVAWIQANPEAAQPDSLRNSVQPQVRRDAARFPGQPAQAAQGCADARARGDHGRSSGGLPSGLRHGQSHRVRILRGSRDRPGVEEHDPGVLL